jgi:acetyl-CoA carboxylase biotin carboxyl carrier protein
MPDDENPGAAPFDLARLVELIEMMEKHGLTEVSLQEGERKWRLRRGQPGGNAASSAFSPPAAVSPSAPAEPRPGAHDGTVTINSPTVGTFYAAATPDEPPFVSVGSRVNPETVVCIVEAMKVFNQIPAEVSGTVVEVLVQNGDSVEYGQPLFRVRPG